jgi:Uma2 family endonuclease
MSIVAGKRYSPNDLPALADSHDVELVDGALVERWKSIQSCYISGVVLGKICDYTRPRKLGWEFGPGVGYRCFPDDLDRVRKADASFVCLERLSLAQFQTTEFLPVCPDLAVHVTSPTDTVGDINGRIADFLGVGTRLFWVVHPKQRTVHVYRAQGPGTILRESDELDGEDVIPGFRCRVAKLFETPA